MTEMKLEDKELKYLRYMVWQDLDEMSGAIPNEVRIKAFGLSLEDVRSLYRKLRGVVPGEEK